MGLDELLADMRRETDPAERRRAENIFWQAVTHKLERYFGRKFGQADAEDLTQRAVLVINEKLKDFQPKKGPDSFRRLLSTVARRTASAHWRTLAQREAQLANLRLAPPRSPPGTPSSQVLASERATLVAQVQHSPKVTECDRGAIEHGDHHSLAEAEGITLSVARKRWNRAVDKVRTLVEVIRRTGRVRMLTPKSS